MDIKQIVGTYISATRERQNMSQQHLADITGVPRSTISRIETGKHNITIDTLHKLLQALDRSIEFVNPNN